MSKKKPVQQKLIQFRDMVPTDIEGKPIEVANLHKTIAAFVYKNTQSLDMMDIAMEINRGKPVKLTTSQRAEILGILNNPALGIFANIRKAVKEFLEVK